MSRVNKTQFALLGLLNLTPMSGYDLKKTFDMSLGHFWAESYGQIYPILKRLQEKGWAQLKPNGTGDRPARRVYSITPEGRQALEDWLATPSGVPPFRIEMLLKLFFGRNRPQQTNLAQVEDFRMQHLAMLDGYSALEARLREQWAGHPDLPYWLMTLEFGKSYAQAVATWCDGMRARLNSMTQAEPLPPELAEAALPERPHPVLHRVAAPAQEQGSPR